VGGKVTGVATSSNRGIIAAAFIVLVVGSLFAFRFYQGRSTSDAEAAGPRSDGGGNTMQGQGGGNGQRGGQGGNNNPGNGPGGGQQGGGGQGGGGNFGNNRPPLVGVAQVSESLVREQISLVGSLKPRQQVQIVPRITGKVQRVLVDVGDEVKEGQLIAELEGDELGQQVLRADASLAVAEATLSQREAELANAKADQARGQQLFDQGLVSVQSKDSSETRVRVVESQLKLAEAQIRQAQADLKELTIRQQEMKVLSPLTGWIGHRYVDPGTLVNPNSPIVDVLNLATMFTEVKVPEEYMAKLKSGNQATVSIDALGGQKFEGHVTRIAPILDAATRSGSVQVEIANTGGQLKAEMSARIQMEMGTEHKAVVVPRDAVIMRGQLTGVNVLDGERVRFREIQTGVSTEQGVEVLEGLNPGITIVIRGSQGLQDGTAVEVQGKQTSPRAAEDRS
jgi:RND family efflux transporter MFP subunit